MECIINGVTYETESGTVFVDEYSEVLNSATVKINHVAEIVDLKPYDDVFLDGVRYLVDQFTEDKINLTLNVYNYTIDLFSETKGLETVQLPNKSVTEPLVYSKKKSVYTLAQEIVALYSPKIKVTNTAGTLWEYKTKYEIDYTLQYTFGDVISPDFTLNSPNLRDYLTKLFITKDCIPYVKDNVIYALNITERLGVFDTTGVNKITGSRSSSNHADVLKRNYNNALSQDFSCRMIENLGFRNSSVALMTLENMQLETRFNMYKANKVYMCYYKQATVLHADSTTTPKMFLCKQDITKLVKLNSERALLSLDWSDFNDTPPSTIDEMAEYKLCTVGYDIGDNKITGWGTKYTYPQGWWDTTKTYIENIASLVDSFTPYGIYSYGYITNDLADDDLLYIGGDLFDNIITPFTNDSLKQKAFFFEVDYNAFYNGTVLHSKDNGLDNIQINDNSSSSLTLLEEDGLFQKEKINRFGNKALTITARYDSISDLQALGSVYDDDNIIYHREYTVANNGIINALYYATKDYVLKNYYTSVYAKQRPYNLLSYGESTRRSENKKDLILLSKDDNYSEETDYNVSKFLSTFLPSDEATSIGSIPQNDKINYGYILFNNIAYASDVNSFVTGNSLCFNLSMFDNVSAGVYIKTLEPEFNVVSTEDDVTGSTQDWYLTVDDIETGFAQSMGFFVCHVDKNTEYNETVQDYSETTVLANYDKMLAFPKITLTGTETNVIGETSNIYKDNKEIIDMTYQFEPVSDTDDIIFSSWFMKLNDLQGRYNKVFTDYTATDRTDVYLDSTMYYSKCTTSIINPATGLPISTDSKPLFVLKIPKVDVAKLKAGLKLSNTYPFVDGGVVGSTYIDSYVLTTVSLKTVSTDLSELEINVIETYEVNGTNYSVGSTLTLKNNSYLDDDSVLSNTIYGTEAEREDNYYYSSLYIIQLADDLGNTQSYNSTSPITSYYFTADCGNEYSPLQENVTDSSNGTVTSTIFTDTSSQTEEYAKNMFIVTSASELTKTVVYDELSSINATTDRVDEIFFMDTNDNLRINTTSMESYVRSVQLWFYDNGSYKFVFGVNLSEAEITSNLVTIYTNIVKNRDTRVYDEYGKYIVGKATTNNGFNVV